MRTMYHILAIAFGAVVITACAASTSGSGLASLTSEKNQDLYFDQLDAVILASANSEPKYLFHLNNPTTEDYFITSMKITDTTGTVDLSKLVTVTTAGQIIPAEGRLDFRYTVHTKKPAYALIKAKVKNSRGETKTLVHLLHLRTQLSECEIISENVGKPLVS